MQLVLVLALLSALALYLLGEQAGLVTYVIVLGAAAYLLFFFRCPRCQNYFSGSTFLRWPFRRACPHCKTQVGDKPDHDRRRHEHQAD